PSPFSGFLDVVEGARDYRSGNGSRQDVQIEAIDDLTLQIRLTAPAPYFLDMLSHQSMTAIHPDQLTQENWHELESLYGSGPFQLESLADDHMEFVPNPHYWDAHRIQLDRIRIDFSEDVQEVTEHFNEGEIQWAMGNFDFSEVRNPDFVLANPVFSTSFFFFNHRQEAYRNSRIRRGLTLLIPWEEIRTDQVYYNPSDQLVPQIPGYEKADSIHSQDVDAGLELLRESGYPLGRGLTDITIRLADGSEQNRIAQVYKQAIEEHTEITVNIEQLSAGEDYYSSLERNDYTIGNITWIGDYLDPLTFLMLFISDSGINNSAYENPEYDELIEAANRQENSERLSTLAKAEALLLQEGAVWPINHTVAFHLVNTEELEGWFPTALDLHPVKFLRRLEFLPGPGITRLGEFDEP
ncbi:MAG: peptide ABC transporter substrate-binding protein, partial [Spirochaeta sp.]